MPRTSSGETARAEEARFRARLRKALLVGLAAPVAVGAAAAACSTAGGRLPSAQQGDAGPLEIEDSGDALDAAVDALADVSDPCAPLVLDAAAFGTDGACDDFVQLPCGVPPDAARQGCSPAVDLCNAVCPNREFFECAYASETCDDSGLVPDAEAVIECGLCIGNLGRRPAGLPPPVPRQDRGAVGAYFAHAAYLEAASVDAFLHLEAQLSALDAPVPLRRRAVRAAEDEKRHARTTSRLARYYGAEPERPCLAEAPRLTLDQLARENMAEGCVRESFAALLALHQAERAEDPKVARAMRVIAREEARHAALSWSIHAWALERLDSAARAGVEGAAARAIARLRENARAPRASEVARIAGLPSAASEARLAEAFIQGFFGRPHGSGGGGDPSGRCAPRRARRRRARAGAPSDKAPCVG
jgi:hypothetical protein